MLTSYPFDDAEPEEIGGNQRMQSNLLTICIVHVPRTQGNFSVSLFAYLVKEGKFQISNESILHTGLGSIDESMRCVFGREAGGIVGSALEE